MLSSLQLNKDLSGKDTLFFASVTYICGTGQDNILLYI
jgi:hypothetical protein